MKDLDSTSVSCGHVCKWKLHIDQPLFWIFGGCAPSISMIVMVLQLVGTNKPTTFSKKHSTKSRKTMPFYNLYHLCTNMHPLGVNWVQHWKGSLSVTDFVQFISESVPWPKAVVMWCVPVGLSQSPISLSSSQTNLNQLESNYHVPKHSYWTHLSWSWLWQDRTQTRLEDTQPSHFWRYC